VLRWNTRKNEYKEKIVPLIKQNHLYIYFRKTGKSTNKNINIQELFWDLQTVFTVQKKYLFPYLLIVLVWNFKKNHDKQNERKNLKNLSIGIIVQSIFLKKIEIESAIFLFHFSILFGAKCSFWSWSVSCIRTKNL